MDRWIDRYPVDWYHVSSAGSSRSDAGRGSAIADFRFVLDRRPNHATARRRIAEIYLAARELNETERLLKNNSGCPDDIDTLVGLAETKNVLGRAGEALPLVE